MSRGRARQYRWRSVCLFATMLLLAAAVRLYQVSTSLVWLDEAFSVRLSQLPVDQIIFHTTRDVHPPLYYLLLHGWMWLFGSSALAVRSLSAVAGTATVGIAMLLTWRLYSGRAAAMAGLLLAVLPAAVRFSQQARMYPLLGLLLLGATYLLWRWATTQQFRYLAGYGCLMVAGLYTHYFTAVCAAGHWVFLLLARRGHGASLLRSRSWWLCNLAIGAAFIPWLPHLQFQWQHRHAAFGWIAEMDPPSLLALPQSAWFALVTGDELEPAPVLLSLLLTLLLLLVSKRLVGSRVSTVQPGILLISYCFVPVLLTWTISQVMQVYMNRYLLYALLGLPLLLACAVDTLPRRAFVAGLAGCLLMELPGLAAYHQRQAAEQPGAVMARINDQWRPGDGVLAIDAWVYYPVDFYNTTGQAPLLHTRNPPDTRGQGTKTFGLYSLLYRQSDQIYVADSQRLVGRYERIWLVSWPGSTPLEHQLRATWKVLDEVHDPRLRAVLFAVPDAPAGTARPDQIDDGSKLSARAIRHMRE